MQKIVIVNADLTQIDELKRNGADEVICALQDGAFTSGRKYSLEEVVSSGGDGVLLNRFYFAENMKLLEQQLSAIRAEGLSSIYFSDPSVLYKASQMGLAEHMIYQPETLVTSRYDAAWWKKQGLKSVCVSPLVTLEELEEIGTCVPGLETVIHGRLLLSESRRPLLSAYGETLDGRVLHETSGLTLKEEKRDDHMPVYEDELGTLIYSDFVQHAFAHVKHLSACGFERLQINALYLDPKELNEAVALYRRILDGADGEAMEAEYRAAFPNTVLHDGYYREKTIK